MKFTLAPMRGIGDFTFRNSFHKNFNQLHNYYTPFIEIDYLNKRSSKSVFREIIPEYISADDLKEKIIPQIITKNSENLLSTYQFLKSNNYNNLNLNLGCPFPQSINKGRGYGLLHSQNKKNLDSIISFLETETDSDFTYSLKIRTGNFEFNDDLNSFNFIKDCQKLKEIIIHPRTAKMIYQGKANPLAFLKYYNTLKELNENIDFSYNGDITSEEVYQELLEFFDYQKIKIDSVMIGRGLLRNPLIAEKLKINRKEMNTFEKIKILKYFLKDLLSETQNQVQGDKAILLKLKEKWNFFCYWFEKPEKVFKIIKKSQSRDFYLERVDNIFEKFKVVI